MSKYPPILSKRDVNYALQKVHTASLVCKKAIWNYPRWEGYPVTLCDYNGAGADVTTYFMNASKKKLAQWVVTACIDAGATDRNACIIKIAERLLINATGNVYPISGFVPERVRKRNICYFFRDGVTILTRALSPDGKKVWPLQKNRTCKAPGSNRNVDLHHDKLTWVGRFSRLARTEREHYQAQGGAADVGVYGGDNPGWLDVTRALYKKAWWSRRNELISMWAISAKSKGQID